MPSSTIAPSWYVPDSGGVNLPVQRTEKPSSLTCGAGLPRLQSKLTCSSVLTSTGSPCNSLLLKYSPFNPDGEPFPFRVRADAGTGATSAPVNVDPSA